MVFSPSHREIIPIENVAARKGRVRYALGSKCSQTDLVGEIADPGVSALYAADTPTRFRPLNIPRHRELPVFLKNRRIIILLTDIEKGEKSETCE